MTCGIYLIVNSNTNMMYIGSSVDIEKRWKQHQHTLNNGIHDNRYLQFAWDKHGSSCFRLAIGQIVIDANELVQIEQLWLEKLFNNCKFKLYNVNPKADRPPSMLGCKRDTKAVQKTQQTKKHYKSFIPNYGVSEQVWNAKEYIAISPDGTTYLFKSLSQFCREHGLTREGMRDVANGTRQHYKLWRCYEATAELKEAFNNGTIKVEPINNARRWGWHYRLTSPEGQVFETNKLTEFAKLHNLCERSLRKVAVGKTKHYKDWTAIRFMP